ncbi:MAG TPA: FKBP-type peptidyl-prolyl cis-trans isomerase [Chitinophagaceae bacterium]|nr:FKBP-type peptidyl-prolyl cis-trans isomerase [Chitinophagaceae bacterium]
MKKLILIPFISLFLLTGTSCVKDKSCVNKTVASEEGTMMAFATANGITATRHSTGLYYQIIAGGSGTVPNLSSTVSVTYTGKFLDGTLFEQVGSPTALFPVSQFIPGWQVGLQQIQKGGSIKLIVPSSMAYGCKGYATIPGNTILYFEITLVDVQ